MFTNYRPASGRHAHDYERDGGDFKFKIDIPFFSGNLNIEDFINWITDIDKFFAYIEVLEEKRVRLVACRLKGVPLPGGRGYKIGGSVRVNNWLELGTRWNKC